MDWSQFPDALSQQKIFSDLFFDGQRLSPQQKQEFLKSFALSLHSEATGICEAVNYKEHRLQDNPVDVQKILYKSVDAYRYILAILNLWEIDASVFTNALQQKDEFLHYRHKLSQNSWSGQPVVLFDVDDVLAEFREAFCAFVSADCGHHISPHSDEYYNVTDFKKYGLNDEQYFDRFIKEHGFLTLRLNEKYHNLLKELRSSGYWVQIVTARHATNLTLYYDTFSWLARNSIEVDGVTFATEKFMWLSGQSFYRKGRFFAVDDSAKHAAEYAKHGVQVLVPEKPYNSEVRDLRNVIYVPSSADPVDFAPKI